MCTRSVVSRNQTLFLYCATEERVWLRETTRPAARRAGLIVSMDFTIKSCVRHHLSKGFVHWRWEKSWLVCQHEEGDSNDVYAVAVSLMQRKQSRLSAQRFV